MERTTRTSTVRRHAAAIVIATVALGAAGTHGSAAAGPPPGGEPHAPRALVARQVTTPSPQLPARVGTIISYDLEKFLYGDPNDPEAKGLRFEDDFQKLSVRVRRKADASGYTVLAVYPQEGIHLIDTTESPDNGFPSGAPGRVIAKIVNEGTRREHGMRIPAGTTVFWIVERDPKQGNGKPGRLISKIVKLTLGYKPQVLERLAFRRCHTSGTTETVSRIRFGPPVDCDPAVFVRKGGLGIFQLGTSPWFPCVQGCCIAADLDQAGTLPLPCTGKDC